MACEIIDAPKELEQLIVYEIAAKNFTSPNGPESGTFVSLEEKLPYLEELGVNGIWLSGHQLCETNHFYNIWTEYACIRPDQLDPTLGTEETFKHFIESAHGHGLKVFLDVITHGVMKDSPLVKEHPDWFLGGSWGMSDFDWYGGHADLDAWWVDTWLRYIKEFGIDGYRLDVAHYRNDLWALVRKKAAEFGKKIIIIAENGPAIRGVVDILQHGEVIAHNYGLNRSARIINDVAGYCKDRQMGVNERYDVKIFYEDGTVQYSSQPTWYQEGRVPEVIEEPAVTRIVECSAAGVAYQSQTGRLRVENIYGEKTIDHIQVCDRAGHIWNSRMEGVLEVDYKVTYTRKRNGLIIEFPLRVQEGQFMSIQLSCHDGGWDGFEGENPYTTQGSRYLAGYTTLLAPGVPFFMAGEEFNADYRPLPGLSPKLFGGEGFGEGKWLYGSWIDWEQLNVPEKAEMLADMKCIIGIRKAESHLIKPCKMGDTERNFCTVEYEGADELPVPYCYQEAGRKIIICANPYTDREALIHLNLKQLLETDTVWSVRPLFGVLPDGKMQIEGTPDELQGTEFVIGRDKTRQGGLLVLKCERTEAS